MRSEDTETLSYLVLGTIFTSLELLRPYAPRDRRQIGLDLLGGGVGLAAVVLARGYLKHTFDRLGVKQLFTVAAVAGLPSPIKILIIVLAVDFCLYWIHRAMHTPQLWRTHVLHHTIESMTWLAGMRTSAVHAFFFTFPQVLLPFYVFGASQIEGGLSIAAVIFAQIFIHSNIDTSLGPVGRWILVTPNAHRIHHGYDVPHGRNLGSVFILWDRLFGTWLAPEQVGKGYRLGLGPESRWEARRARTLLGA